MQDLKNKALHVLRIWESKNDFIEKDEFCGCLNIHDAKEVVSYDCTIFFHEIERSVFKKKIPYKGRENFEPADISLKEVREVPYAGPKKGTEDHVFDTPIEKTKQTETCERCDGDGKLECSGCNGHGKLKCGKCHGNGEVVCPKCNGGRIMKCTGLWGLRQCKNGWVRDGTKEKLCSVCGGSGTIICKKCDVHGRVQCEICNGAGTVRCSTCSGSGHVTCKGCDGAGKQLSFVNVSDKYTLKTKEHFHQSEETKPFKDFKNIKWNSAPFFEVENTKYDDVWKEVKRSSPDILFSSIEDQIPKLDLTEDKGTKYIYFSKHISDYKIQARKVLNIVSDLEYCGTMIQVLTQDSGDEKQLLFSQDPAKIIAGNLISRIEGFLNQNMYSKAWNVFFRAFRLDKENDTLKSLKRKFRWFIYKPFFITTVAGISIAAVINAYAYQKTGQGSFFEGFFISTTGFSIIFFPVAFIFILLFGYRSKNSLKPVFWYGALWLLFILLNIGLLFDPEKHPNIQGNSQKEASTSLTPVVNHTDRTPSTFPSDLPKGYKRVFIESPVGYINMRSGPSTNDPVLVQLPNDEVIYVEDKDELWLKAYRPLDKSVGWVNKGRLGEFAFPYSIGR